MGNRWALALLVLSGCPTIELGDEPAAIGICYPDQGLPYFVSTIEPRYFLLQDPVNGCARSMCHDSQHGGLSLSPADDMANFRSTQAYIRCGDPLSSPLLTKPLAGVDGHEGGDIFTTTSDPRVVDFVAWFQ
jgi:hypothetical protein